jgi:hypothetical protein
MVEANREKGVRDTATKRGHHKHTRERPRGKRLGQRGRRRREVARSERRFDDGGMVWKGESFTRE